MFVKLRRQTTREQRIKKDLKIRTYRKQFLNKRGKGAIATVSRGFLVYASSFELSHIFWITYYSLILYENTIEVILNCLPYHRDIA